jgi:predicted RNA-binding protein with RPS1 domain
MSNIECHWEQVKLDFPIGHQFYGKVASVKPFGVFVHLDHQDVDNHQLKGIIDIATQHDCDSFGLPEDRSLWPRVGQIIYCKVISYRGYNKEVDLRLIRHPFEVGSTYTGC